MPRKTMMIILRTILAALTALVCVAFALAHTQTMTVMYSPVHEAVTLPVAVVVLAMFGFGFVIGGLMVWLNGHEKRAEHRALKKKSRVQDKEIDHWRNRSSESAIIVRQDAAE